MPRPRLSWNPSQHVACEGFVGNSDREFDRLVTLVVEVYGESELERAMARALWNVAHRPVDPTLRHLIPPSRRGSAVQTDASMLRDAVTSELRLLVRPH